MVSLLLAIIYISFVSLGLPDALLGAGWPTMFPELGVPVSFAGGISLVIALGTIVSSLFADRLIRRLGTGKLTALIVAMTALALFGFSFSKEYWHLILWAIPYGLGAGGVDASLNNYVAVHYSSRVMSWLHCMWGLGASIGPYVMGYALGAGMHWSSGYFYIGIFQVAITAVLLLSLPMWVKGKETGQGDNPEHSGAVGLRQVVKIKGAKEVLIAFFCYCAVEQTAMLWGSTYLVSHHGMAEETAAIFGSLFLIGLTLGRAVSGFLTVKINDRNMIRLGQAIMVLGLVLMLLPLGKGTAMAGLLLNGLGCAPIYPCIIHSTPEHFGPENSQAIIGVQMASAYTGILVMPPLFGLLANHIGAYLLPFYMAAITALMICLCERLNRIKK